MAGIKMRKKPFQINTDEAPFDVTKVMMPFGKHRGQYIGDLPEDYITWVIENCDNLSDDVRKALEHYSK